MVKKKKYLAIITQFQEIDSMKTTMGFVLKKLSEEFENIYYINAETIGFFPPNFKHDISYIKKSLPDNFILFEPKSTKEFSDFLNDKELLVVNCFGRYFPSIKIHYLLKKFKIKQVQLTNVGQKNSSSITTIKHPLKAITYHTKKLMPKITLILANIGLVEKIDIRFLSNKTFLKNIKINKIKNFLYNKNLFFAKELIEVNSVASDILKQEKKEITEDYIVHLDASLNYYHQTDLRGNVPEKVFQQHYLYLDKFLKNLSNVFNKEIIVCIHPRYNLEEHQKYLPNFKVIKFKTREYVYKAFLVTTLSSSAVIDAVLLKKKIIGITSDFMTKNENLHSKVYSDLVGYMSLNTKEIDINKQTMLKKLNDNIKKYDYYINNFLHFDDNKLGIEKIISIIKERYFQ
mgnify:CR=1 FL=1